MKMESAEEIFKEIKSKQKKIFNSDKLAADSIIEYIKSDIESCQFRIIFKFNLLDFKNKFMIQEAETHDFKIAFWSKYIKRELEKEFLVDLTILKYKYTIKQILLTVYK